MKTLVALFACTVPVAILAAEECTFDQNHQATVIESIAKLIPGGSANVPQRLVTWVRETEGTTTFGYGGCADLGSVVTRSTPMAKPRTQEQVFSLARELATRFWSHEIVSARLATQTLISGLDGSKYTTETSEGRTTFAVKDPNYVQLYVEHEYKDGVDRVTIAWQGNF